MSLLNQVLQDLDARQPQAARPVLRTAAPSIAEHAADDFASPDWQALLRPGMVIAGILLILLLAAWVFERAWQLAGQTGPAIQSQPLTLPEPVRGPVQGTVPSTAPPETVQRAAPANAASVARPQPVVPPAPVEVADPVLPAITDSARPAPVDDNFLPLRNATLADLPDDSESAVVDRSEADRPLVTKSIRPVPKDPLDAARRAIASGELAAAEVALTTRLQRVPKDLEARELLIGLMLRGQRSSDALRELDAGLARHPAHGSFVLIKARLLAQSGDKQSAIVLLERHAGVSDIRAQRLQMLGALYQQDGRFGEAAENYRALLAIQPGSAAGWVGVAISLDAQGDDGAAAAYRRALRLGGLPASAEAYARGRLVELE